MKVPVSFYVIIVFAVSLCIMFIDFLIFFFSHYFLSEAKGICDIDWLPAHLVSLSIDCVIKHLHCAPEFSDGMCYNVCMLGALLLFSFRMGVVKDW